MAQQSKRHHFLPQMYLRGFTAEDDLLSVYDRKTKELRRQAPNNTAVKKDFYSAETNSGEWSDLAEQILANTVEGPAAKVIHKIENGEYTLTREDREALILFVALFRTRTPAFDKEYKGLTESLLRSWLKSEAATKEKAQEWLDKYHEEMGPSDEDDVTAEELITFVHGSEFEFNVPRQNVIKSMLEVGLTVAEALGKMNLDILIAPDDYAFVTNDNPLIMFSLEGALAPHGIDAPGIVNYMPLTSKRAVAFHGNGGRLVSAEVRKPFARDMNHMIAQRSERFLIGRDQPLVEYLIRKTKVSTD